MLGRCHRCDRGRSAFRFRYQDVLARSDIFFQLGKPVFQTLDVRRLSLESSNELFFQLEQPIKRSHAAQQGRQTECHPCLQIIQPEEPINAGL